MAAAHGTARSLRLLTAVLTQTILSSTAFIPSAYADAQSHGDLYISTLGRIR
jgi:hypothetical protein